MIDLEKLGKLFLAAALAMIVAGSTGSRATAGTASGKAPPAERTDYLCQAGDQKTKETNPGGQKPAPDGAGTDKPASPAPAVPNPSPPTPAAPAPKTPGANPAPAPAKPKKPLPPQQYYQLLLERQRLAISSNEQVLKILDAYNGDPIKAMNDLKKHEDLRKKKVEELFTKYETTADEYYRSQRSTDTLEERSAYLDGASEIRDEIAENSKTLKKLEAKAQNRMKVLWQAQSAQTP